MNQKGAAKPIIFARKNRRAQFYLIAAIVIISVIIGFAVISNSPKKKIPVKLYDLKQELGIESANVLAYGTYSELNETEMRALLQNFVTEYVAYAGQGRNLYFIFGNQNKIIIMSYQTLAEEASVNVGGEEDTPLIIGGTPQEFTPLPGSDVVIKIDGEDYTFPLNTGENFYFVISEEIGGETYVVTG